MARTGGRAPPSQNKRSPCAKLSARARQDAALKIEVRRVFDKSFRIYGARKVWRQLKREGSDVARCTISRLMRTMGLQGVIRSKSVRTATRPRHVRWIASTASSGVEAEHPLALRLHLCCHPDRVHLRRLRHRRLCSQDCGLAGGTFHAGFVLDALEQALHDRRPVHRGGLVHHSDRGAPWPKLASSPLSAVSAIPKTMLSPKPSTVSTRLR